MKKIKLLTLSLISLNLLSANTISDVIHDLMDSKSKGKSYNGLTDDIIASQDGTGIVVLNATATPTNIMNASINHKLLQTALKNSNSNEDKISIIDTIDISNILTSENNQSVDLTPPIFDSENSSIIGIDENSG